MEQGQTHSINRLCILISYVSHVLLPSPQGVFLVVTFKLLVGNRTGPLTRRSLDLARSISSWHTFSSDWTFREVRVMRILWIFCASVRYELAEVVGGNWNWEERMKEAESDANLQVLRQSLFLAFGKTSLLVWTRTRWVH